jgi:hypothetical protein
MTVDVSTKSAGAVCVDGNMAKNHSVKNVVRTKFAKVFSVLLVSEDVMVAADKNLVTVETPHDTKCLAVNDYISEMIDFVIWTHPIVPTADHFLIHFRRICPGPDLGHTVVAGKATYASMSKMRVTYKKYCWHSGLLML